MRKLLFTLMWIACAAPAVATVYKWVDESGVVHYSDQPHENAQKVELKAPQTYSAPKTPAAPAQPLHDPISRTEAAVYKRCAISEPTNEQVYMNTSTVTAGVSIEPAVRPGDSAVVTLDGQRVPGVPATGGQFEISPVDRGAHTIQMTVQSATGATVCSSPAVTFYVRQPSLQSPTQPVRPH